MPMILEGRAIPDTPPDDDREAAAGTCIFCGKPAEHVNDGGGAWMCHGLDPDGTVRNYLYHLDCSDPARGTAFPWRCGCVGDYVENVGDRCAECRRPRVLAEEYPCSVDCPECGELSYNRVVGGRQVHVSAATVVARDPGPVTVYRCTRCGWTGWWDAKAQRARPPDPDRPETSDPLPRLEVWTSNRPTLQLIFHGSNRKFLGERPEKIIFFRALGARVRVRRESRRDSNADVLYLDGVELAVRPDGCDWWVVADRWCLEQLKITALPRRP